MCLCSVPCIYAHKWPNTALLTLDSHTHTSTLTQQLLHARISYSICMDKRVSMHGFATELSEAVAWSICLVHTFRHYMHMNSVCATIMQMYNISYMLKLSPAISLMLQCAVSVVCVSVVPSILGSCCFVIWCCTNCFWAAKTITITT